MWGDWQLKVNFHLLIFPLFVTLRVYILLCRKWLRRKILKISAVQYFMCLLLVEFLSDGAITLPAEDESGGDGADGAAVEEEGGV